MKSFQCLVNAIAKNINHKLTSWAFKLREEGKGSPIEIIPSQMEV